MNDYVSARRWPDTFAVRQAELLEQLLVRRQDDLNELVDSCNGTVPFEELRATAQPLPDGTTLHHRYFALELPATSIPCRIQQDGSVRVGLVGESTNTSIDLINRLLEAQDVPAGPTRLALAGRLYAETRGARTTFEVPDAAGCSLCGGGGENDLPLARCRRCEVLFRPNVDAASWRSVYGSASGAYFNGLADTANTSTAHGYEDYEEWARVILGPAHFDARVQWIVQYTRGRRGKALDVGCATGEMAAAMSRRGWESQGVDLSTFCIGRALATYPACGFAEGTLHDCDGAWDVISYLDVFEHLSDPLGELVAIRQRLRPGGLLLLELPNQGSLEAEFFGVDFLFEEHLYYYDSTSISRVLGTSGFEVVGMASSHDAYYRIDRLTGPAMGASLARELRGERLLVAARRSG